MVDVAVIEAVTEAVEDSEVILVAVLPVASVGVDLVAGLQADLAVVLQAVGP